MEATRAVSFVLTSSFQSRSAALRGLEQADRLSGCGLCRVNANVALPRATVRCSLDASLRGVKEALGVRALTYLSSLSASEHSNPSVQSPPRRQLGSAVWARVLSIPPNAMTFAGLYVGLLCACLCVSGSRAHQDAALLFWAVNRLLDGMDGVLARFSGKASDWGALLDISCDFVVYAAIPIGLVVGCRGLDASSTARLFMSLAFLLASYFVNNGVLFYLSALLEKRKAGAEARGERTSVTMCDALIGGSETVLVYCFMFWARRTSAQALAFTFDVFSFLVGITALQRLVWARAALTGDKNA